MRDEPLSPPKNNGEDNGWILGFGSCLGCFAGTGRADGNLTATTANILEGYIAFGGSEDRKVATLHGAGAGIELVAILTDDDVTGNYKLAAEALYAQTLRI